MFLKKLLEASLLGVHKNFLVFLVLFLIDAFPYSCLIDLCKHFFKQALIKWDVLKSLPLIWVQNRNAFVVLLLPHLSLLPDRVRPSQLVPVLVSELVGLWVVQALELRHLAHRWRADRNRLAHGRRCLLLLGALNR